MSCTPHYAPYTFQLFSRRTGHVRFCNFACLSNNASAPVINDITRDNATPSSSQCPAGEPGFYRMEEESA